MGSCNSNGRIIQPNPNPITHPTEQAHTSHKISHSKDQTQISNAELYRNPSPPKNETNIPMQSKSPSVPDTLPKHKAEASNIFEQNQHAKKLNVNPKEEDSNNTTMANKSNAKEILQSNNEFKASSGLKDQKAKEATILPQEDKTTSNQAKVKDTLSSNNQIKASSGHNNQQAKEAIILPKEDKIITTQQAPAKDVALPSNDTLPLRMTKDTYEYLLKMSKEEDKEKEFHLVARSLAKCFEGQKFLIIPGRGNWTEYCRAIFDIISDTSDNMLKAEEPEEKTVWRTRMFNVLEVVYQSQAGKVFFDELRVQAERSKEWYPIADDKGGEKVKVDIKDFDDVSKKKLYLTSFFPFEEKDFGRCKEDYHYEFQHGEDVAIPTECKAVKKVLQRAKELKEEYSQIIGGILTSNGGEHFKCGYKSYLRTIAKLNELISVEKKERPAFKYLFDLLRCKAHYMKPEDAKKAYEAIAGKFQVLRVKNKMHTHLKNVTFNIVYKDIISEIQLALGKPQAESENHILYEIERTHSMAELYEVVEGWGGYDFSKFKPLEAGLVEIDLPKYEERYVIIGDTKYKLLKSKEHFTKMLYGSAIPTVLTYFDEADSLKKIGRDPVNIRYGTGGFFVSICSDLKAPKPPHFPDYYDPPIETFTLDKEGDVIVKVEGYKREALGIQGLKLHSKKGQVIELGTTMDQADFVIKAPPDSYIVAFGGQMWLEQMCLISLYCWIYAGEEKLKYGYQGEMKNGAPHGKGVMMYPDGSQYDGEWKDSKKHGRGILYNTRGNIVYDGEWAEDKKHGEGRYNYSQNETYFGNWKNDKREGIGHYSNSTTDNYYYGPWKNDKLNGVGTLYNPYGECTGLWEDNYCKNTRIHNFEIFRYSGGVVFDAEKKTLLPHGRGVFDPSTAGHTVFTGLGIGEWDHGKGKGCLIATDRSKTRYEGGFNIFACTNDRIWYYLSGKVEGTFNEMPMLGKCYCSDGVVIEGSRSTFTDKAKWKLYPTEKSTTPVTFEPNTKMLGLDDSYYHAQNSTLYYIRTPLRFVGKAVNFLSEDGMGTWYLVHGHKVTGSWKVDDEYSFEGTIEYPNRDAFKGKFKIDLKSFDCDIILLEGTMTIENGNRFEGTWDLYHKQPSKGTLFYPNGDRLEAVWNDRLWESGEIYFSNGEKCELDDYAKPMYKNGDQVIAYKRTGDRFELDWDMVESDEGKVVKGICYFANGDRYEGEIRPPCDIHGKGVMYYANGQKFEGEWDCETLKRKGKYYLTKDLVVNQECDEYTINSCSL